MTMPGGKVKTPVGDAPVVPVVLLGAGMFLTWFGVHYWRSDVKWPTDPIKAVLQGRPLPANTRGLSPDQQKIEQLFAQAGAPGGGVTTPGEAQGIQNAATNALNPSIDANVNTGKLLAAGYGWGPGSKDWPYLYSGWQEESGWNQLAANVPSDPYNHAYGIPQANPGSKMASAGAGWKTDPAVQIRWGLAYIKSAYGAPSRVPGWTPNGPSAGYVGY
jgi:hypothetical protein